MQSRLVLVAVLLAALAGSADCADYPIEVIELQSRPLEQVLLLVKPFIGPDGTVTGMGSRLVIKAAPDQVGDVKRLMPTDWRRWSNTYGPSAAIMAVS